jgi:hypothetical protein
VQQGEEPELVGHSAVAVASVLADSLGQNDAAPQGARGSRHCDVHAMVAAMRGGGCDTSAQSESDSVGFGMRHVEGAQIRGLGHVDSRLFAGELRRAETEETHNFRGLVRECGAHEKRRAPRDAP